MMTSESPEHLKSIEERRKRWVFWCEGENGCGDLKWRKVMKMIVSLLTIECVLVFRAK